MINPRANSIPLICKPFKLLGHYQLIKHVHFDKCAIHECKCVNYARHFPMTNFAGICTSMISCLIETFIPSIAVAHIT